MVLHLDLITVVILLCYPHPSVHPSNIHLTAFSASFSASLAGLLWKGILEQKGIFVKQSEFAKLNLGINVVAMIGGCSILIAQLYIRG